MIITPFLNLLLLLALALFATSPSAAEYEKLIMPGELIEGHAKYESECSNCHNVFGNTKQATLCLDCHEKVKKDLLDKTGFHGKNPDITTSECKSCHTDHKGRKVKIANIDIIGFNHKQTDFTLEHAHQGARCDSCHVDGKKYRDTPVQCHDCHKDNDIHKEKLGKQCADCHNSESWTRARFDHDKTKFKLTGKHTEVRCAGCHAREQYKETPKKCVSCHLLNDIHESKPDTQCQSCHNDKDWRETKFDHDKNTKFSLKGKHDTLQCRHCHQQNRFYRKTEKACFSCHKDDDHHKGRLGKKCSDCHNEEKWSTSTFDHNRKTKFSLSGAHRDTPCSACHSDNQRSEKTPRKCIACHAQDDTHNKSLGERCNECHADSSWGDSVRFDHDMTSFPLNGLHASTPCEECHDSHSYTDIKSSCSACHSNNDKHEGVLGTQCQQCHNPNSWALWRFDHDSQTDFKLTGAHSELICLSCHTTPMASGHSLSSTCQSCHRQDDIHDGDFGQSCERCHTTKNFKDLELYR